MDKNIIKAANFISKYPLAAFLDERHVDFSASLVKSETQINVIFVGFGELGREIFLASVANNQFLTMIEEKIEAKAVNCHIFDKNATEETLNDSFYRYKNGKFGERAEEYLPLPPTPSNDKFYNFEPCDGDFYAEIKKIITRSEKDANFIIIALENNTECEYLAKKLVEKRREWGANETVIFANSQISEENCYYLGEELDPIFEKMAPLRNAVYDLEYAISSDPALASDEAYIAEIEARATENWAKKSDFERNSTLFACLSLRSKLNLMGLDICSSDNTDERGMSEGEYLVYYAGDDMPTFDKNGLRASGKPIITYTLDFVPSRRKTMAVHEHLRWNSFMITSGFVPSTRNQILCDAVTDKNGRARYTNGKSFAERRHGNLTTFEGLLEFRKLIAVRDGVSEAERDVIKYDYQLLDDAHWLLSRGGFKIIKKGRR